MTRYTGGAHCAHTVDPCNKLAMRDKRVAPNPPSVMGGRTAIAEAA
jgi:hypothetical protein